MEHPPRSAATPRSSWPRTATPAGACRPIWARTQTPAVRSAPRPGPPCATAARHRLRPGRGRFGHVILVRGQRAAKPGPDGDGAEATGTQQANPDCGCTGGDEVGCQCGADDERQGLGEGGERVGRPRIVLSVRRLTSGPVVGASTVSPSPKSAVKPNTKAARPMGAVGSAARPSTAQETARISPLTARALLPRARRTRRNTNSWASTMRAVLMVSDRATNAPTRVLRLTRRPAARSQMPGSR